MSSSVRGRSRAVYLGGEELVFTAIEEVFLVASDGPAAPMLARLPPERQYASPLGTKLQQAPWDELAELRKLWIVARRKDLATAESCDGPDRARSHLVAPGSVRCRLGCGQQPALSYYVGKSWLGAQILSSVIPAICKRESIST